MCKGAKQCAKCAYRKWTVEIDMSVVGGGPSTRQIQSEDLASPGQAVARRILAIRYIDAAPPFEGGAQPTRNTCTLQTANDGGAWAQASTTTSTVDGGTNFSPDISIPVDVGPLWLVATITGMSTPVAILTLES